MPAVSGSPTQIATSVAAAIDLAGTPDDAFTEGDLACVRSLWPQSTFRLRRTSLPYGIVPNNVTAIATFSGNGYWELFPQGGSMLTFPNIASLASFDDQNLGNGAIVYVQSVRSYWSKLVETNPGTANAITVVRNPSDTATWYRNSVPSPSWDETAVWAVAGTSGNDEHAGTPAFPLKTFAEFNRRVQQISTHVTVQVVESSTEYFYGTFASGSSSAKLSIVGTPTLVTSSSTNTVFVDPVTAPAANVAMGTVSATGLDFSTSIGAVGNFIRAGSSVAPVLGNTGATAHVPFFSTFGQDLTKPVDGTTVEVLTLKTIPSLAIATDSIPVDVSYLRFTDTSAAYTSHVVTTAGAPSTTYFACMNDGYLMCYAETFLVSHLVNKSPGPYSMFANKFVGGGSRLAVLFIGGGMGTVALKGFATNGTALTISSTGVPAGQPSGVSFVAPYGLGIFNTTGVGLTFGGTGSVIGGSPLYGKGANMTYGLDVYYGSLIQFDAGYTPAIVGTTSDFRIDGNATSMIPPLTPNAAVPPLASISGSNGTGWGKWEAAPFNRQLVSYSTGTKICAG